MATAIHRRVDALRAGHDPTLIARVSSGWAVMGDPQVLPGYCLLLPDPVVPHLNALSAADRTRFLDDLARLGDAALGATGALRINYAIFGNQEPALHAHVLPRFADEPDTMRSAHPWAYDWTLQPRYDRVAHAALRCAIRDRLVPAAARLDEPGPPLDHIDLTVTDLAASTRFYAWLLERLGFARQPDGADGVMWRCDRFELGLQPAKSSPSRPHDRYSPGLHHLAFAADSRDAVDRLHAELIERGVPVLDPPALYEVYEPGYYALNFADPDGIKLEVAHRPTSRPRPGS
jgi:catechol 2,3-dioxygenase-like lactoylglutathione lyase family enzyme/diadenosine tetraphosphate (Ap4A) HIT family hydrolase